MPSVEKQFHVPSFPPFPSAERYVPLGSQDDALQRVCAAVEAWEAISLVIGPPGTGKSTISQVLQKRFSKSREVIVFGDATLESPQSLQRHLLNRLDRIRGIKPAPFTVGDDPQLAIIERIANSSKEFAGLLLLVDEAQSLSPEVLETIRIFTNTMTAGRPRVSAVFLGGPKLDETLALPSLDALVQRVATRCYVHPFSSDETVQYVRKVLQECRDTVEIKIDETAIRSIHRACSGVPRLVNQLMTAAISYARSRQQPMINQQTVDRAWSVLQQLPGPLVDEPELRRPVSNVEFGPLSDDGDDPHEHETGNNCGSSKCGKDCGSCDHSAAKSHVEFEDDYELGIASEWESLDQECSPVECESDCEAHCSNESNEFMMQTEFGLACGENSSFDAISFDCQATGDFDYDHATLQTTHDETMQRDSTAEQQYGHEPVHQLVRRTPSSDELFGEFDEEEPVSDELQRPTLHVGETATDTLESDRHAGEDLESSLHREILSLRSATSAPVLWMEDGESDEPIHDDRDMLVIEDDVNVENAVAVNALHDDEDTNPVAVDFHSMLAKMRATKR
jgi:type II secretory pathway predicted ATPase ExeA